jgi:hypothetical protein
MRRKADVNLSPRQIPRRRLVTVCFGEAEGNKLKRKALEIFSSGFCVHYTQCVGTMTFDDVVDSDRWWSAAFFPG